jgi:hypothetical protein
MTKVLRDRCWHCSCFQAAAGKSAFLQRDRVNGVIVRLHASKSCMSGGDKEVLMVGECLDARDSAIHKESGLACGSCILRGYCSIKQMLAHE